MPACLVQRIAGEAYDMERVYHRDRVGELFGGGLEPGEPVHRDHLDPYPAIAARIPTTPSNAKSPQNRQSQGSVLTQR